MRTKAIQTDLASLNYVASATWNKEEEKRVFTFGPKNLGYWVWHTPRTASSLWWRLIRRAGVL